MIGIIVVLFALPFRKDATNALKPESNPTQHLPKWAFWWDDPNNGTWGDIYWRTDHHPNDYKSFWVMWKWLAIRNPATGFAMKVLGVFGEKVVSVVKQGIVLTAETESGRKLIMIQSNCPRILWGPDNSNITNLKVNYWYPFQVIIQPWVCRK